VEGQPPQCSHTPHPCPQIPGPPLCNQTAHTFHNYSGYVCKGCDRCVGGDTSEIGSQMMEVHNPVCPPLPCPKIPGPPLCNKTEPTYYNNSGHVCRGCDRCVGGVDVASSLVTQRREVQNPQCPHLPCPKLPAPPLCNKTVATFYNTSGHICRGCDQCDGDDTARPDVVVPTPMGTPPCDYLPCAYTGFCTKTKHTYYVTQGVLCVGCDDCDRGGSTATTSPPQ